LDNHGLVSLLNSHASSIHVIILSTPQLNGLRVERFPSTNFSADLTYFHRLEAFPAVYRAPGLLGTVLVMYSQGFADGPDILLYPTHSHPHLLVSPAGRIPPYPIGITTQISGGYIHRRLEGDGLTRFHQGMPILAQGFRL
jgi:hypothetical protein